MSILLENLCGSLADLAPLRLAESWDNVGLLVGDRRTPIRRVMTCLTISPNVVDEAVQSKADVIVAHHPLPFKALQKITADTITGEMLLKLIGSQVAIYSAHTAFDSAVSGINQMWAETLKLQQIVPLVDLPDQDASDEYDASANSKSLLGAGRVGKLSQPVPLRELVNSAADAVSATVPRRVGAADQIVTKVALACGSGGTFLSAARRKGCDAMITGEATFHTCLEAESSGIGLGLLGHYWSERFAMERLAEQLAELFPDLSVWASRSEHDPIEAV